MSNNEKSKLINYATDMAIQALQESGNRQILALQEAVDNLENAIESYGDSDNEIRRLQSEIVVDLLLKLINYAKDESNDNQLRKINKKKFLAYVKKYKSYVKDISKSKSDLEFVVNKKNKIWDPVVEAKEQDIQKRELKSDVTPISVTTSRLYISPQLGLVILIILIIVGMLFYVHDNKVSPKQCTLDLHLDPNKLESKLIQSIMRFK